MRRVTTPDIPIEVQQAAWEDLWDELLHPSVEDPPLVEEAQRDATGSGAALLQREADTAA